MSADLAEALCRQLRQPTRNRIGCGRPNPGSHRSACRPCRTPACACGPSAALDAIRAFEARIRANERARLCEPRSEFEVAT